MDEDASKSTTTQGEKGRRPEQFPVDTKVFTKVQLYANSLSADWLRIVVTNDMQTTQCAPYREYNYCNAGASIEDITSFTMRCERMEVSQQAVDAHVGSMEFAHHVEQIATWHRGVYAPSAARKRLYKAVDPDDSTRRIGLLVEQDAQGQIVQLTWYKTKDTGTVFGAAPGALEFELVRDDTGAPSVDPNNIGGWTWYYAIGGAT